MKVERIGWLLLAMFVLAQPSFSQGMVEQGGLYSSVAGLGAGLAASRGGGGALTRSFESVVRAQNSLVEQTKVVEATMRQGCQYEAAKQWEAAENTFKYVLQGIARRDGPGSSASVPVLEHLVTVTQKQNKLEDAINYEKTVIAFTKAARVPDLGTVIGEKVHLSNLFILKNDYSSAEPVLHEVIQAYEKNPSLPSEQRCAALTAYAQVLRKLNKQPQVDTQHPQTEQPKPAEEVAQTNSAKEEATELMEAATKGILSRQARLLTAPVPAALQGQDTPPQTDAQANSSPKADQP